MTTLPSTSSIPEPGAILRYRRILLFAKRKWWIPILCALIAGGVHWFYLLNTPGDYTAMSRMWVGGRVRIPESSFFTEEWQNFFGTQIELMQSEKIRMRALTSMTAKKQESGQPLQKLEVTQPRKTTIFNLSMKGSDPDFLMAYLNATMDEYLKYKKEVRASSSDDTVASLGEQLEKVEGELKTEQERIADFQRTNNLSVLQGAAISAGNQLARLHLQLSDLQLEHDTLELTSPEENLERRAVLAGSIASRTAESTPSSLPADYLAARQQRELKRFEQTQKGLELLPEHPTMVKLAEDITRIDAILELLRKQSEEDLGEGRRRVQLKMKAVGDAIKSLEPQVADMNQRLAEYERHKASLDRVAAQQTRLLQAMHNVGVNKSVDQESVSVMERTIVFPTPRRMGYHVGLSSLVAVIFGLGIILLVERMDVRVMSSLEARSLIPLPILGCVPRVDVKRSEAKTKRIRVGSPLRLWEESFRRVRMALTSLPSMHAADSRVILFTSATPSEGKTLVMANLGRSLAQAGFSVLMMDGDVHQHQLSELFCPPSSAGLSELSESQGSVDQLIVGTDVIGLSVMSAGLEPAVLERQASSEQFGERIRELRRRFNYILIDTPPVLASSEARLLARGVDGVVFVASVGISRLPAIEDALSELRMGNAVFLGLVLNGVPARSADFAWARYRGYEKNPAKPQGQGGRSASTPGHSSAVLKPDTQLAKG